MRWGRNIFYKNFVALLLLLVLVPLAISAEIESSQPAEAFSLLATAKHILNLLIEGIVKYSFQVFGGIVVLVLGWFLAKFLAKAVKNFLEGHQVDVTIIKFLAGMVKTAVFAFAVLIALGKFGIEIAPFIAGLSVVGFGTSFALQGPLSNYAAGASLIFTKPFRVGDIIEVVGVMGEVEDMSLPRTAIRTIDDTVIVIPNKHIIGEIIHNYSGFKKLDLKVGISYNSDVDKAVSIVKELIRQDPRTSRSKESKIGIFEFADSSVNVYARIWCSQADYWDLLFDLNKKIFMEFQKNNIIIPFPQRVVHLHHKEEGRENFE